MTFEGLGHDGDRSFAGPELRHRETNPFELRLGAVRAVEGAGKPHHQDRRRLGLDRQVGEHAHHQRLFAEEPAERTAVRGVMGRLRDGLPHQRRRADDAVESGVVDHVDDRPYPSPLFADQHCPGLVEPDLR